MPTHVVSTRPVDDHELLLVIMLSLWEQLDFDEQRHFLKTASLRATERKGASHATGTPVADSL